jgi:hypothetical protein
MSSQIGDLIDRSIDRNRQVNKLTIDRSIDYNTTEIKKLIGDETLGEKYIAHAIRKLGFGNVISIAEYVSVKADNPGRAFIGLCQKEIRKS